MALSTRKTGAVLWVIQVLLAALFLYAGGFKLAMSLDQLAKMAPLPGLFLKFIGVCEVLGALGLLLPGIFRIRTGLTPLAAAGLVIIMIGAVVVTIVTMSVTPALFPLFVGILAAIVAYGRWRVAPLAERSHEPRTPEHPIHQFSARAR